MADAIESYVIQIGIDQKATLDALKKLQASLGGVEKTTRTGEKALGDFQDKAKGLGQSLEGLVLPLASIFGLGKMWNTFAEGGRQLQHFSEISEISAHKLDMWAQANEAAGGSYEAFIQGVVALKQKFRMSDEQIFGLGKTLQGMDRLTQIQYLRTLGLSPEAGKVFMQYGARAQGYAQQFAGTAMTGAEAKAAREASNEWRKVEHAVKRLGNTMAVTVLPVVTSVFSWLYKTARAIEQNETAVKALVTALALPMAIKGLTTVYSVATSILGVLGNIKNVGATAFAVIRFHPIVLALTALAGALTLIINQFGGWGKAIDRLASKWQAFKESVAGFSLDSVSETLTGAFDVIKQGLKDSIVEAFTFVADLFKGIFSFEGIKSFFSTLFTADDSGTAKANVGAGANTGLASNVVTTNTNNTNSNQISVQTTNNVTVNGNADPKAVATATQQGTENALSHAVLSNLVSTR